MLESIKYVVVGLFGLFFSGLGILLLIGSMLHPETVDHPIITFCLGLPMSIGGVIALNRVFTGSLDEDYSSYSYKSSKGLEKFILNRIVAPTIVGLILGGFTYLITGEFSTGGGIAIIGSVVTIVIGAE